MNTHSGPIRFSRRFSPTGITAGLAVALTLLFSACGESPTNPTFDASDPDGALAALALAKLATGPGHDGIVFSTAASNFTLLANAAVTATDATITGDVGTFLAPPTGSVTLTKSSVSGTVHVGDGAAVAAYNYFLSAYAALAPQTGDECTVLTGTLDGVTLAPGTYCFDAAAVLTGTLTLDGPANGTWIFKIGTSGTGALTGTNFDVVMAGGAQACNVTWWVADAVTMTDSNLQGNILAGGAITLTRGTLNGNAWSKADVTVSGTTATGCEGATIPGNGDGNDKKKCNQGVGNGPEGCDPGNSNNKRPSNDENGGIPGNPGRKGGR